MHKIKYLLALAVSLASLVANGQLTATGYVLRKTVGEADLCLFAKGASTLMKVSSSEEGSFEWYFIAYGTTDEVAYGTTDAALADSITITAEGYYRCSAPDGNSYSLWWLSPSPTSVGFEVDSVTCDEVYASAFYEAEPMVMGSDTLAQTIVLQWDSEQETLLTTTNTTAILDLYDEGLLTIRAINQVYNEVSYTDTVYPIAVKAAFSYNNRKEDAENEATASTGEAISSPAEVELVNESKGSYTVSEWAIGTAARLYETSPVYQFQKPGTFVVSLTVTNESAGCAATDSSVTITVSEAAIEFPNAFTPNGDGVNDIFCPSFRSIKSYSLTVYNRWGRKIYESTDPSAGWDGYENGRRAATGVYYYYCRAYGYEKGVTFNRKGSVTLIR